MQHAVHPTLGIQPRLEYTSHRRWPGQPDVLKRLALGVRYERFDSNELSKLGKKRGYGAELIHGPFLSFPLSFSLESIVNSPRRHPCYPSSIQLCRHRKSPLESSITRHISLIFRHISTFSPFILTSPAVRIPSHCISGLHQDSCKALHCKWTRGFSHTTSVLSLGDSSAGRLHPALPPP